MTLLESNMQPIEPVHGKKVYRNIRAAIHPRTGRMVWNNAMERPPYR